MYALRFTKRHKGKVMRWVIVVIVVAVLLTKIVSDQKSEVQKMNEEIAAMQAELDRSLGVTK